jgi:hypothetical protein
MSGAIATLNLRIYVADHVPLCSAPIKYTLSNGFLLVKVINQTFRLVGTVRKPLSDGGRAPSRSGPKDKQRPGARPSLSSDPTPSRRAPPGSARCLVLERLLRVLE